MLKIGLLAGILSNPLIRADMRKPGFLDDAGGVDHCMSV